MFRIEKNINEFRIIKDISEFKEFIKSLYDEFDCHEDWERFFGFELKYDEYTGEILETIDEYTGKIKNSPENYPVVMFSLFDVMSDFRHGDTKLQVLNWISFDELIECSRRGNEKTSTET